eukprot:357069-Chlamydomonas_euryale.AAC.4
MEPARSFKGMEPTSSFQGMEGSDGVAAASHAGLNARLSWLVSCRPAASAATQVGSEGCLSIVAADREWWLFALCDGAHITYHISHITHHLRNNPVLIRPAPEPRAGCSGLPP